MPMLHHAVPRLLAAALLALVGARLEAEPGEVHLSNQVSERVLVLSLARATDNAEGVRVHYDESADPDRRGGEACLTDPGQQVEIEPGERISLRLCRPPGQGDQPEARTLRVGWDEPDPGVTITFTVRQDGGQLTATWEHLDPPAVQAGIERADPDLLLLWEDAPENQDSPAPDPGTVYV